MHNSVTEIKYISLQEAGNVAGYSQEYLSLRARKGKLKAVKIGKVWHTRKEWLDEYLGQVGEYKQEFTEKRAIKKEILPPDNLPTGELPGVSLSGLNTFDLSQLRANPTNKLSDFSFIFVSLIFCFVSLGWILGHTVDIKDLSLRAYSYTYIYAKNPEMGLASPKDVFPKYGLIFWRAEELASETFSKIKIYLTD